MNPFSNIITPEFKELFNNAIDAILDSSGLTIECILKYGSEYNLENFCNNCILDTISRISSNIYNGTGPIPFVDGGICPICVGSGMRMSSKEEKIKLAVIIDNKNFINVADIAVIESGVVQTICDISLLSKIKNAVSLTINDTEYQRMIDPRPCGLSNHKYIVTLWKNK